MLQAHLLNAASITVVAATRPRSLVSSSNDQAAEPSQSTLPTEGKKRSIKERMIFSQFLFLLSPVTKKALFTRGRQRDSSIKVVPTA